MQGKKVIMKTVRILFYYRNTEREVSIIYYIFLFRLYVIDIAYEYNSTSSFENGYIYIHCQ